MADMHRPPGAPELVPAAPRLSVVLLLVVTVCAIPVRGVKFHEDNAFPFPFPSSLMQQYAQSWQNATGVLRSASAVRHTYSVRHHEHSRHKRASRNRPPLSPRMETVYGYASDDEPTEEPPTRKRLDKSKLAVFEQKPVETDKEMRERIRRENAERKRQSQQRKEQEDAAKQRAAEFKLKKDSFEADKKEAQKVTTTTTSGKQPRGPKPPIKPKPTGATKSTVPRPSPPQRAVPPRVIRTELPVGPKDDVDSGEVSVRERAKMWGEQKPKTHGRPQAAQPARPASAYTPPAEAEDEDEWETGGEIEQQRGAVPVSKEDKEAIMAGLAKTTHKTTPQQKQIGKRGKVGAGAVTKETEEMPAAPGLGRPVGKLNKEALKNLNIPLGPPPKDIGKKKAKKAEPPAPPAAPPAAPPVQVKPGQIPPPPPPPIGGPLGKPGVPPPPGPPPPPRGGIPAPPGPPPPPPPPGGPPTRAGGGGPPKAPPAEGRDGMLAAIRALKREGSEDEEAEKRSQMKFTGPPTVKKKVEKKEEKGPEKQEDMMKDLEKQLEGNDRPKM
ncbi:unnamed protein product [Vitrella brassicaformis CCMP3155]|uniref:WH2 domain-containing protein n=1 Tax=Vitrella brassicaformis (strain CCMP3155) TaxID=1169540 RepID=A0A0G4FU89_VITBC|nr:unnamed protein product [Vitrella brassicaformis CCMP3155]|eukprot:CEM18261.1 unnamed protein product [Vitrella brassicaformis CCMP3155]